MSSTSYSRRRRLVRGLAFASVAAAGYIFGITTDRAAAQPAPPGTLPPGVQPNAQPQPQAQADRRTVAYIYGNVPVTREELGDFLIARGGWEKLELLVNKKIIEVEARRRGVTISEAEVKKGLEDDLRGLKISQADFEKLMLPRVGKSMYEWTEDVIKPRLILTKMCKDRVKVTDDDLNKLFQNQYGEKRQARVICWSKKDLRAAQSQWAEARKSDEDFIRVAKTQADPALAAAGGLTAPLGRNSGAADLKVEKILFSLKVGEISQLIEVPAGVMCVKLVAIIPADPKMKPEGKVKEELYKVMYEKRLSEEIPKCFMELKKLAQPNLLLTGPPSTAQLREGVDNLINQAGGVPRLPGAPAPTKP